MSQIKIISQIKISNNSQIDTFKKDQYSRNDNSRRIR
jgi:hypothetical protein